MPLMGVSSARLSAALFSLVPALFAFEPQAERPVFHWPSDLAHVKKTITKLGGGATISECRILTRDTDYYGVTLVWVTLPRTADMRIVPWGRPGNLSSVYDTIGRQTSATVVFTGGYIDSSTSDSCTSKGLIKMAAQPKPLSALFPWQYGGVFIQAGGRFSIVPIADYRASPPPSDWALQSEPILIARGQVDRIPDKDGKASRVALALDRTGLPVVIGSFGAQNGLRLFDFARFLALSGSVGGPDLVTALNLDGGPLAHLFVPELKRHFGNMLRTPGADCIPNVIAFSSRGAKP
jgi:hypothetical protein